MSDTRQCSTCDGWIYGDAYHCCPPKWLVWSADSGEDDAREIYATDESDAAEKWAEREDLNSAEYSIVRGNSVTVCVRGTVAGAVTRFDVSGESVPSYSARELP